MKCQFILGHAAMQSCRLVLLLIILSVEGSYVQKNARTRIAELENLVTTLIKQGERQQKRIEVREAIVFASENASASYNRRAAAIGDKDQVKFNQSNENLLYEDVRLFEDYLRDKTGDGDRSKRQTTPSVAFTAVKIANQHNIGTNQNIMFEQVLLNIGGGYHVHQGVFAAPVSGIYVMAATIQHSLGQVIYIAIKHNGNILAMIHGMENEYAQGTHSLALHLIAGDEVWLSNQGGQGVSIFGAGYSSFSGFLLY
ncbi:complement C1q tumor necrosis factor-related protein 3-like [Dreissena polymorpha]|uniref:C1q domain-containing protein n=1 Tax=Dreissena polymorpha TaxID=45954 RepID=A0A9D4M6V0_DREPO|nr:complement C1q tumor necrosis factor-related protein 3-like [Dreissena polymorpha]KAH3870843.1 hypothetical protein DPMN_034034 [Dreissena polymorpha]